MATLLIKAGSQVHLRLLRLRTQFHFRLRTQVHLRLSYAEGRFFFYLYVKFKNANFTQV